jgi:hypothetical protein
VSPASCLVSSGQHATPRKLRWILMDFRSRVGVVTVPSHIASRSVFWRDCNLPQLHGWRSHFWRLKTHHLELVGGC